MQHFRLYLLTKCVLPCQLILLCFQIDHFFTVLFIAYQKAFSDNFDCCNLYIYTGLSMYLSERIAHNIILEKKRLIFINFTARYNKQADKPFR